MHDIALSNIIRGLVTSQSMFTIDPRKAHSVHSIENFSPYIEHIADGEKFIFIINFDFVTRPRIKFENVMKLHVVDLKNVSSF